MPPEAAGAAAPCTAGAGGPFTAPGSRADCRPQLGAAAHARGRQVQRPSSGSHRYGQADEQSTVKRITADEQDAIVVIRIPTV